MNRMYPMKEIKNERMNESRSVGGRTFKKSVRPPLNLRAPAARQTRDYHY
jgi:hypothetical protein